MTAAEPTVDRRVLRGQRNREAVVQAFLDIITAGDLSPTAQKVAAQAGLSLRSVFHHFDDMEQLFASAADLHVTRYIGLVHDLPTSGPLEDRISAFVEERAAVAEKILPVYRAAMLVAHRSDIVAERLARGDDRLRLEVTSVFAAELAGEGWRVEAVDAATSIDAWARLRLRQDLSATRAAGVLAETLRSLLRG